MPSLNAFQWITLTLAGAVLIALPVITSAEQRDSGEAHPPALLNHKMKTLRGEDVNLAEKYHGKVLLIVNVASRCGYTPQYEGLQKLHEKYAPRGLAILGFPCNQFGAQEPGTSQQIAHFCKANYGVTFDMFQKIEVNGPNQCPLYKYLTSKQTNPQSPGPVKWNFEKFLISHDGRILKRFRSPVKPRSDELIHAIEAALKARNTPNT